MSIVCITKYYLLYAGGHGDVSCMPACVDDTRELPDDTNIYIKVIHDNLENKIGGVYWVLSK